MKSSGNRDAELEIQQEQFDLFVARHSHRTWPHQQKSLLPGDSWQYYFY
jgi:hypothetical protein